MTTSHWNALQTSFSVTALAALGVGVYIVYRRFREQSDDEGEKTIVAGHMPFISKEMNIPSDLVAAFIGKGGSKIKELQEKTDTKIKFKEAEGQGREKTCIIRGRIVDVQYAEVVIKQFLSEQATVEMLELWIPERACGMVIGRGGETIKEMSKLSGARIAVERTASSDPEKAGMRKVTVRGTSEQLPFAKQLLEEVLQRMQQQRQRVQEHASHRSSRRATANEETEDPKVEECDPRTESLTPGASAGYIDVFVSAANSPDQFWVQIVGPRVIELDDLVTQLTEFYSSAENKQKYKLSVPQVGDIVASIFRVDQSYYRARVNALDSTNGKASVYFLDFGDTDEVDQSELFSLPTQFMTLRFQAVECQLAGVKPSSDSWSEEVIELFEELALTSKWKPILAKIVEYRLTSSGSVRIPVVQLMNTQTSQDINIASELVRRGFAVPV